jgi:hydroxyacylglutathione hydrolase
MLEILLLPALSDNYIFVLHDPISGATAAVDPAQAEPVSAVLQQLGWQLQYILNTHHHADHVGANLQLKAQTGCKIVGAAGDRSRIPGIDIAVAAGDSVQLGEHSIKVMAAPGHTSGHILYYCQDSQALFCGDTLFSLGCGRLFEGTAEQMWQSLQTLKALPPDTRVYCAHEYTEANGRFALSVEAENEELQQRVRQVAELRRQNQPSLPSTIGLELATNPFLREHSAGIRRALGADDNVSPVEVFAHLRLLKDGFR